jgi:putative ABC transport system permease protein
VNALISHLRYPIRVLLKSPGFTITTVLILGLGIGANTAIFSLINGLMLRPLPYPSADRLVLFVQTFQNFDTVPLGYADYLDFSGGQHSFANLTAYNNNDFTLTGQGDPERISGLYVTGTFFKVLGRPFLIGRPFGEADDQPDAANVVVVSEHLWRTHFHADPKIVGRSLTVDGRSFQVVGVTPGQADETGRADLYVPVSHDPLFEQFKNLRGVHSLVCIGRLADGTTRQQALADLQVINQNLIARYPITNSGFGVRLMRYLDGVVGSYSAVLFLLEAAVTCLLLITCANIANLLLGRSQARRREITIRAALGAGRLRLVLQLLAENSLLALAGGLLGLAISFAAVEAIKAFGPQDIAHLQETRVDAASLLFVLGISLFTAILFKLFPAWIASEAGFASTLKDKGERGSTAGPQRQRSQAFLVGGQVARASILLIGAGLLARSFQVLHSIPLGFNPHNVLTTDIYLADAKYADPAKCTVFFDTLLDKVGHLPGVTAVAINTNLPFHGENVGSFGVAGQPDSDLAHMPLLDPQFISPGYFTALGIPLLRGRVFNQQDRADKQRVVIISERIAERYFAGQDPIGKQIHDMNDLSGLPRNYFTIVGVVANVQHGNPESQQTPFQAYYSYAQSTNALDSINNSGTLVVRTQGDPPAIANAVHKVIAEIDPKVSMATAVTFDDLVWKTFAVRRIATVVVSLFSTAALLLAAVGLYAVLSYSVIQRRHEIGIRMALGAQTINILRLVVRQGLRIVLIGLVVGVLTALTLTQFIGSVLYGVSATDPVTLGISVLVLGLAALIACMLPAVRATRINPITALRE